MRVSVLVGRMSTSKIGDMVGIESSRPVVSSGSDRGTSSGFVVVESGSAAWSNDQHVNAVPTTARVH